MPFRAEELGRIFLLESDTTSWMINSGTVVTCLLGQLASTLLHKSYNLVWLSLPARALMMPNIQKSHVITTRYCIAL